MSQTYKQFLIEMIQPHPDQITKKEIYQHVISVAKGDDNLEVRLHGESKNNIQSWGVRVFKDGNQIEEYSFENEEEAKNKFEEIVKEF